MKIHLISVVTGYLMIKAIQLVKARTRTAIMKMIKQSQESPLEARTRREKKLESILRRRSISLENIVGSVRKGVSTRRQLSNFSSHHAFISCVEPKKVYEALDMSPTYP
jgi:hypothetical protein